MSLVISDELLDTIQMTEEELRRELAVLLFQEERFTLAQAARFVNVSRIEFQRLLASRKIPVHYDVADFQEDVETLKRLERL